MEALDIPRLRGVTHAYAFWLALIAAALLVVLTPAGAPRVAAAIYGGGLCVLFGGSGLYHRWRWNPAWRPWLRRIDHSNIYLFIAASYTPVGMLVLSGATQWIVLITVWAGALAGVTLSIAWINAPRLLCAICYVALGWVAVLAFPQMHASLPLVCVALIALGGVLYTVGAFIFALGRPNPWPNVFGFHEIFHIFVILAAVAHFVAMAGWIVPSGLDGQLPGIEVQLLHKNARLPVRTRPGDAAFDLSCLEAFSLIPGERAMIRTGVAIALPPGYAGLVLPRSGLAFRHGVTCANSPGLVDPNYRGELMVILVNLGGEAFIAEAGDRIAQLLLVPYSLPEMILVDSLSETERGADGFGSSGR